MSLLVVIAVAAAVFIYVRATRQARQNWLKKLDLPGFWQWTEGGCELELYGSYHQGQYLLREAEQIQRGAWQVRGGQLVLSNSDGQDQCWQLHFFRAGSIGLEDSAGQRRLFEKQQSNVVPLRR